MNYGKECSRLRPTETSAGKGGIVALQQKRSWRTHPLSAPAPRDRLSGRAADLAPGSVRHVDDIRVTALPAALPAAKSSMETGCAATLHPRHQVSRITISRSSVISSIA